MASDNSRAVSIRFLMGLLLFQGLSGLLGGYGLVTDPTGASLRIPLGWLEGSPFADYLVPGLILLIVLGFFPLVVLYGLRANRRWAWFGALAVGAGLIIWIGVEITIIGYQAEPPFQVIYAAVGLFILLLALLPSTRRYFILKQHIKS